MKAFTPTLTTLASALITTILANPVNRAPIVSRENCASGASGTGGACDACAIDGVPGIGLWGIFPKASPHLQAGCFNNYTPSTDTLGCECTFDNDTITLTIIRYQPNVPFYTEIGDIISSTQGQVEMTWTANTDPNSGIISVNVYAAAFRDGNIGLYPS